MRIDQSSPVHLVSEFRGIQRAGRRTDGRTDKQRTEILVSNIGYIQWR